MGVRVMKTITCVVDIKPNTYLMAVFHELWSPKTIAQINDAVWGDERLDKSRVRQCINLLKNRGYCIKATTTGNQEKLYELVEGTQ